MNGEFSPAKDETLVDGSTPESAPVDRADSACELVSGRYSLKELIGKGGMGSVFRARDLLLDRDVALKLLPAHLTENAAALARFQREARAAAGIRHPAVVTVHDFGLTESGQPFLVMDLIEGKTLKQLIEERGQLSFVEIEQVFTRVIEGLKQAHAAGVVHRDLKPGNIMLTDADEQEALLLDFGIAKVGSGEGENSGVLNLTQTGEILGSPLYMSPEQCLGEDVDFRADIYSLSCCLYEALTGEPPFKGKNAFETMTMHVNRTPASLAFSRPDLNFGLQLEEVIEIGLAKSREARYQSLEQFQADLISALRSSFDIALADDDASPASSKTVIRDWRSGHRLILLAVLVSVACIGLAFPLFLQLFMFKPLYAALGLIVVGVGLVFLSQLVFGPGGLLFRSVQNRYVGESEAAHRLLLRQLAPVSGVKGALELGSYLDFNLLWPRRQTIVVPPSVRAGLSFALVLGKSGKGKTRLLRRLIRQERVNGSIFVLDTQGALFDGLQSEFSQADTFCFWDFSATAPELTASARSPSASKEQLSLLAAQCMVEALAGVSLMQKVNLPGLSKDKDMALTEVLEGFFLEKIKVDELPSRLQASGIGSESSSLILSLLALPCLDCLPALLPGCVRAVETGGLCVKLPLHILQSQTAYLACFLNRFVVRLKLAGHISSNLSVYIDGADRTLDAGTLEFSAAACGCPGLFYLASMQSLSWMHADLPERLLDRANLLISFAVGRRDSSQLGRRIFPSLGLRIQAPTARSLFVGAGEKPRFFSDQDHDKFYQDLLTNLLPGTFFCHFTTPVESVVKVQLPEQP
ncbi:MAG: serine/threonine-protein kinase [Candidatus Obscuribacter sp.]|nr:serine/threonine-protein kinase [Candidatus Obscuribacter sp.]